VSRIKHDSIKKFGNPQDFHLQDNLEMPFLAKRRRRCGMPGLAADLPVVEPLSIKTRYAQLEKRADEELFRCRRVAL
jgi:hypothetical protein